MTVVIGILVLAAIVWWIYRRWATIIMSKKYAWSRTDSPNLADFSASPETPRWDKEADVGGERDVGGTANPTS